MNARRCNVATCTCPAPRAKRKTQILRCMDGTSTRCRSKTSDDAKAIAHDSGSALRCVGRMRTPRPGACAGRSAETTGSQFAIHFDHQTNLLRCGSYCEGRRSPRARSVAVPKARAHFLGAGVNGPGSRSVPTDGRMSTIRPGPGAIGDGAAYPKSVVRGVGRAR